MSGAKRTPANLVEPEQSNRQPAVDRSLHSSRLCRQSEVVETDRKRGSRAALSGAEARVLQELYQRRRALAALQVP